MRITGLKPQRRNSSRVSVFLDGDYSFSVDDKVASDLGLCVGLEVDAADIERIQQREEHSRAREYALLLLSYRARTAYELASRLSRRKYRPEVIEAVIARLRELKLVDDARFARDYARARAEQGNRGRRMIELELTKLGVGKQDIAAAFAAAPSDDRAARELVRKFNLRYARLESEVRRRRLYAALARRGFAPDAIREAIEQEEARIDDGGPDPDS